MKKINILPIVIFIPLSIVFFIQILDPRWSLPSMKTGGGDDIRFFCFQDVGSHRIPNDAVEINRENRYGQTFTSNFDSLFMMSIFIPKQDVLNPSEALHFFLRNSETELIHLKWKFSEMVSPKRFFYPLPPDSEVTKKGFHFSFQFPVIQETKGKELYFYFESTAPQGKGIKIGVWKNRPYYEALTKGTLFYYTLGVFDSHRRDLHNHFLAFRTFHTLEGSFAQNFMLAINRIKVKLKKDILFVVIYGILLLMIGSFYIKTYVKR